MTDTEIEHVEGELVTLSPGFLPGDPIAQAEYAVEIGKTLAAMADKNKWAIQVQGKRYLQVEGWQFIGSQFGLVPGTEWTRKMTKADSGVDGWEARVVITHLESGNVVGSGESMCDRGEETRKRNGDLHRQWEDAPEYAIRSMAQTRATSRAFRNIVGWAAKAGGFAATPAEEVADGGFSDSNPYGDDDVETPCPACGAAMRYTKPGPSKSGEKQLSGRWWCTDGENCPGDESPKFGTTLWQNEKGQSFDDVRHAWLIENPEFRPDGFVAEAIVDEFRLGPEGLQRVADEVLAIKGIVPVDPSDPDDPDRADAVASVTAGIGYLLAKGILEPHTKGPIVAAMNAPEERFDELVAAALSEWDRIEAEAE